VDEGHFGRAAASLNLTQPALSLRIKALERELGIQLLLRSARQIRLTTGGEALLPHARTLVQEEDRTLHEMNDHVAGRAGHLRISYLALWDAGLPANVISEFRSRYPAVKLEMMSGYSQINMDRLLTRQIDFAFIGVAIGERERIAVRTLDRQEVVLVMAPSHPLAQMESVLVSRLRGEPMIAVSSGGNPRLAAARLEWLTRYIGEPPNIIREEPPDQLAASLAQSRNAVALMTVHRASLATTYGLAFRRLSPAPLIEYGAAYARDNQSSALANLLKTIDDLTLPLPAELPPDSELLGVGLSRSDKIAD
jgi:DNA-binding transcriptional LysR family regulator